MDAGDGYRLVPDRVILGVDELLLRANNDRLFSRYTGLQRHAVGVPLLRHLAQDPQGKFLLGTALGNLLDASAGRSEEHTSELQSLMRISYAVFCLKKKKNTKQLTRSPMITNQTNHYHQRTSNCI